MGTLKPDTKMLVPLFVLLASSFPAVQSTSIVPGTCPRSEWGKETTEEEWECTNGQSSCFSSTVSCSNDGTSWTVGGVRDYDANGNEVASTGGGWDCRDKCRGCRSSCSGSQSRTSFGSRPSSGTRPSSGSGSRNCDYECTNGGGCKVTFVGPPRAGRTQVKFQRRDGLPTFTDFIFAKNVRVPVFPIALAAA